MAEATSRALTQSRSSREKRIPPPIWFEIEAVRILAIIEGLMADLGGKKFAEDFKKTVQTQIASAFAEGQAMIKEATQELTDEIRAQSRGAARIIRQEAQTVREAFAPTTGNNPPEGDELDPTKGQQGDSA
jgi:hypothetical protein